MKSSSRFWDKIAPYYSRRPVADEVAYQKKLQITREYFHPEMKLLEFGCGTGSTALVHAPHVQHILAIDVSEKMLEIARAKAETAGITNVQFEQTTIESLDATDAGFDMVLGLSILHLVEDKDAVIAKVHRLLKPGGIFVSSTACLGKYLAFIEYFLSLGRVLGLMPLVKVFDEAALTDSLVKAGFSIEHQWLPKKNAAVFIVARKANM